MKFWHMYILVFNTLARFAEGQAAHHCWGHRLLLALVHTRQAGDPDLFSSRDSESKGLHCSGKITILACSLQLRSSLFTFPTSCAAYSVPDMYQLAGTCSMAFCPSGLEVRLFNLNIRSRNNGLLSNLSRSRQMLRQRKAIN